jgi:hypothetical protein
VRFLLGIMFLGAMVPLVLAGCGGKEITKTTPIQDLAAPEWVVKGSGAYRHGEDNIFYGVGSAYGIRNFSLLRTAADNRARNELAKVFEVYTSSLMKDYAASTMAGDPNQVAEEQHVEEAVKTVTSATLSGVEIVERWQHPATGELYSLAKLDLEEFENSLEKVRELNKRAKEYIRENAERLHEELRQEEERLRER